MNKHPLLDELRAQREKQEAEILEPAIKQINKIQNDYVKLWQEKNRIVRLASSEFGKYFLQEFFANVSMHLRRKYLKAINKLDKKFITFKISSQTLKLMSPEQFENYVLRQYANALNDKLDMSVSENIIDKNIQTIHIYMPKQDYHQTIALKE